jgi:hypothetical protein
LASEEGEVQLRRIPSKIGDVGLDAGNQGRDYIASQSPCCGAPSASSINEIVSPSFSYFTLLRSKCAFQLHVRHKLNYSSYKLLHDLKIPCFIELLAIPWLGIIKNNLS